ncbi:MAG: hypothetical protein SGARI_007805 [Bacillariaceae sp.]
MKCKTLVAEKENDAAIISSLQLDLEECKKQVEAKSLPSAPVAVSNEVAQHEIKALKEEMKALKKGKEDLQMQLNKRGDVLQSAMEKSFADHNKMDELRRHNDEKKEAIVQLEKRLAAEKAKVEKAEAKLEARQTQTNRVPVNAVPRVSITESSAASRTGSNQHARVKADTVLS